MRANDHQDLCSIVIPTLNEGDMLHNTVQSICEQTDYPSYEIVIVDDGSTDGSCDIYQNTDDSHIRLVSTRNLGVARARNLGASKARGSILVFLDAHCRVPPNWLNRFVRALEPPDVAIAGPCFTRLESPEPRGCGMTWISESLQTAWGIPLEMENPYIVPFTPGGCQAVRATTFQSLGQYDDGFKQWGSEDLEICLRAWLLGYQVVADPNIIIAHYFREQANYEVNDSNVIYNYLRTAHVHFSPQRIRKLINSIGANPHLSVAMEWIFSDDTLRRREQMTTARVRDDRWFFEAFMPQLH